MNTRTRSILAATVAVALAAILSWTVGSLAQTDAEPATENRAPFSLVDQTGQAVTDRDFTGSFMLILFGYTHCPDICPTDLVVLGEAVDLLGEAADAVQPIFITIDPARDTVEVMADYVKHFHPRLVGLTGTQDQISQIGKRYGVEAIKYRVEDETGEPQDADDYYMDHTGAIYLIGPDGAGLTYFLHGVPATDIAATVKRIIDQMS